MTTSQHSPEKAELTKTATDLVSVEEELIKGNFQSVSSLSADAIPNESGIYCIKLREGSTLPSKYGKIREDRIIYIGIASKSLRKRLWEEELNHKRAATFFRSIGAMLDYLPPKGSLYGKKQETTNSVLMTLIKYKNG